MRNQIVYDVPTRLFHWLFAGLFLFAFIVTKLVDTSELLFSFHSLAGLTLVFVIILRLVWGIWGTRNAKFLNFALNPMEMIRYGKGILTGDKKRWGGHNPASSWAALVMMGLALSLGVTGYLMTVGSDKDLYEDAHELLANSFMIVVMLHIAGVITHSLRHRDFIAASMVDGKKSGVPIEDTIASTKPVFGGLLLALVLSFGIYLYKNFNTTTGYLDFFGTPLEIGEDRSEK